MAANDYSEVILNESDDTFKIVTYAFKNSKPSTMKGSYSIDENYINLKFKNAVWRVKI